MTQITTQRSGRKTLLTAFITLLVVIVAIYSGIWLVLKNRTENALAKIQPQLPVQFTYSVGGYPFHLTITLHDMELSIPPKQEELAIFQTFGFTPAKTGGTQFIFKGDADLSFNLFGKSAVLTLPTELIDESGKLPVEYSFNSPVKLELGYSTANAAIFANLLADAPTPEGKELFSRLRSLSYSDNGGKIILNGKTLSEWKASGFHVTCEPVDANLNATLKMHADEYRTTDGLYALALDNAGDYRGAALLFKDFAAYIFDYPLYVQPISGNVELQAIFPIEGDKEKPFTSQFTLTRLFIHDGNGDSIQTGNLTVNREGVVTEVHGDFAWKAENFPASLSRYAGLVSNVLKMTYARQDEIARLTGKPVKVPTPAQTDMVVPAVVAQVKALLTDIGALEGDLLTLNIEKKQNGELIINGKPFAEVQPIMQQHMLAVYAAMGDALPQQTPPPAEPQTSDY